MWRYVTVDNITSYIGNQQVSIMFINLNCDHHFSRIIIAETSCKAAKCFTKFSQLPWSNEGLISLIGESRTIHGSFILIPIFNQPY